jgi:hypothetical protein
MGVSDLEQCISVIIEIFCFSDVECSVPGNICWATEMWDYFPITYLVQCK